MASDRANAIISTNVTRDEWEKARGDDGEFTAHFVISKVRHQSEDDRKYTDDKHRVALGLIDRLWWLFSMNAAVAVFAVFGGIFLW